jgi:hypothetical protein
METYRLCNKFRQTWPIYMKSDKKGMPREVTSMFLFTNPFLDKIMAVVRYFGLGTKLAQFNVGPSTFVVFNNYFVRLEVLTAASIRWLSSGLLRHVVW